MGAFGQYVNYALGSSLVDGERCGEASAKVVVFENLASTNVGNYSNGDGMQSTRQLAESQDGDTVLVTFTPHDNPYGVLEVEIVQKI